MTFNNLIIKSSKWLSPVIKILLFILLFLAFSPTNQLYYTIVDWFAVVGFSYLTYISIKQEKVSSFFYGFCALIIFFGMAGFTKQGIYSRELWKMIDVMAYTIIFICSSYEIAIGIIKKDHEKEIKSLKEKNEIDLLLERHKKEK